MDNKENNFNISNDDIEIIDDGNEESEMIEVVDSASDNSSNSIDNTTNNYFEQLASTDTTTPVVENINQINSINPDSVNNVFELNSTDTTNVMPSILQNNVANQVNENVETLDVVPSNTEVLDMNMNSIDNNMSSVQVDANSEVKDNKKVKNKGIKLKLAIVASLFIVLFGGLILFKDLVLLNKKNVVSNSINAGFNYLEGNIDNMANYFGGNIFSSSNGFEVDAKNESFGFEGKLKITSDYNDGQIDLTKLKNYSLQYGGAIDAKNNKLSLMVDLDKNNNPLILMASYISGKTGILECNQLFFYSYIYNIENEIKDMDFSIKDNTENIKKIISKIKEVTNNYIDDKDIAKEDVEETINGSKGKYTKFTYKIDLNKYYKNIIDEFLKDDSVIKALSEIINDSEDNIKSSLTLSSKSYEEKTDSSYVDVLIYVDNLFGNFKQVIINKDDASFKLYTVNDGSDYTININDTIINGEIRKDKLTMHNDYFNFSLENKDQNNKVISFGYKSDYSKMEVVANIKNTTSSDKMDYVIDIDINYGYDNSNINFKISNEISIYKNATVKEITPFFSKNIDEITQTEMESITNKLKEIYTSIIKDIYPSYKTYEERINGYYNNSGYTTYDDSYYSIGA